MIDCRGRLLIVAAVFLFVSCAQQEEYPLLESEERVAFAYAELTLLSESARLGMLGDTSRAYAAQADSILQSYGMTREEFERQFQLLADDPERSSLLFESASKRIQALRARRDSSASLP